MRRRGMYSKASGGLPSIFTQLTYLQSDGSAYIDTGIVMTQNHSVEMCHCTAVGDWRCFGSGTKDTSNMVLLDGNDRNQLIVRFANKSRIKYNAGGWWAYKQYQTAIFSSTQIGWENVIVDTISDVPEFETPTSVYIFAAGGDYANETRSYSQFKYVKIWDGEELVRDFVPVQRNTDNVYGMFDFVSRTFFTNEGTGNFTGGI